MSRQHRISDHTIDTHVGRRLRTARKRSNLSQGALGDSVGLTFQQIQKHENGEVRISAGRLMNLANALEVPIEYFFKGFGEVGENLDVATHNTLDLSDLSEIKSTCVRLIADVDDADIEPIVAILNRLKD